MNKVIRQKEIERKFIVRRSRLPELRRGVEIVQGYLKDGSGKRVRLETMPGGKRRADLTKKSKGDLVRDEEIEIILPKKAEALLGQCGGELIRKTRYLVRFAGHVWEVDVFHDSNEGLIAAEIELETEDEVVELPPWIYAEVTYDPMHKNRSLSGHPFSKWSEAERKVARQ